MKTIKKMYFKYEDILKSESDNKALEINSFIRCYVKIRQVDLFSKKLKVKFVVDVIDDSRESSELKLFESISDFNKFVNLERWLND